MDKKFYGTLAHITIPIMVQEFINSLVNILDTFMIGTIGVHEITAVGLANQLFFVFILFTFGICSGSSVLMGQFWGADDVPSIRKTLGLCLGVSIIIACAFSCIALFAPEFFMGLYSKDERVIELGASYLGIIWISYLLCAISMSLASSLKSMRQTKLPMFTSMLSLSCNAILNYIFIFILHMGIIGAAIGTVIARFIEACTLIAIIYGFKLPIAARLKAFFTADIKFMLNFAFVAAPVLLNESVWGLGTSIYNAAYKYCGTEAQGALQIANSIQTLFMVVGMSIGFGCGIMIANALGAGEIDSAVKYSRRFMKMSVVIGIIMGAVLVVGAPFIAGLFNVSDGVRDIAVKIMYVVAAGLLAKAFNFTTIVGILRSGGDTWFGFAMDFISVWFVGIPLAFLGAAVLKLPIYWVVALVLMEEVIKLFFSTVRVLKNGWAKKIV